MAMIFSTFVIQTIKATYFDEWFTLQIYTTAIQA